MEKIWLKSYPKGVPAEVMSSELLSEVYECPIEVVQNPRSGALLVVPYR